jgi:hypothetical protein
MRPTNWFGCVAACGLLAGCGDTKGGEETTDDAPPPPTGPTDSEETGDTAASDDALVVAAIGWEVRAAWNQEANALEGWVEDDWAGTNGGIPSAYPVYVLVTLANLEYFESASGAADTDNYCQVAALFQYVPTTQSGEAFDWDRGFGGTGDELPTSAFYEGVLTFLPDTADERCSELDTELFPSGDPYDVLDGMRFGVGYGPLSPYLLDLYTTEFSDSGEDFSEVSKSYITQFIAVNHDDGDGGVTFPAYDWNSGYAVETDYEAPCVEYTFTSTTYVAEYCGVATIDATDPNAAFYVGGDATVVPFHGLVLGGSRWLEDTPNLDLSNLKDDAIAF